MKLRAAALNRLGSWVRNGWSGIKPAYPHIPGSDGAGDVAEIEPGESVLEVGVSEGINTASIPIAKLAGATVYVVGSGTAKLEQAESMGADFLIDRSNDENRSKKIHKLKDKNDVDAVVDNVSTTFSQCFCTAHNRGRILMVGNSSGPKFEIDQVFYWNTPDLNRFGYGNTLGFYGYDGHSFTGSRPPPILMHTLPVNILEKAIRWARATYK